MDFLDLLNEYRIPHFTSGPKTHHGWVNFKCPFCEHDRDMGYSISGRFTNCWNCGSHSLFKTIESLTGLPKSEILKLGIEIGLQAGGQCRVKKGGQLKVPVGLCRLWTRGYHTAYLQQRGFDPDEIETIWNVQAIGESNGKLAWRLFIPIYFHGEMVSWTTRAIGERTPKYIAAKDEESAIPISDLLYGYDFVRNIVIVVEGPVDAWAIGPGAVALCGQSINSTRLNLLSKIPNRFICFDSERDAQKRARKLMDDLSVFPGRTTNIVLETGKDPADAMLADDGEIDMLRKLVA